MRLVPLLALLVSACTFGFPHSARPTTSLRLHGTPADAVVTVDEERVGPLAVVAARGVALRQGTHQVTVVAPGFFPWDRLVEAKSDLEKVDLDVQLVPVPE